jgi:hypothetical protein
MRARRVLMRASMFWLFCEREEDRDVNENMTAMARTDPISLDLIDVISSY